MLTDRGATGLSPADDFAVTIHQLLEQLEVLVIDVHRARPLAINEQRILLDRFGLGLGLALGPIHRPTIGITERHVLSRLRAKFPVGLVD